jgi:tetratricopeptide (TPR) repeat protein
VSLLFREKQKDHLTTVSAVEKYLNQFCADHDLLQQDMPNILQATKLAEGELLLRMVSVLVLGGYPFTAQDSYVDSHGFPRILVEQLQRAIGTAAEASPLYDENLHYLYGKLGNYSFNEAQFDRAVIYYQKALELSPDLKRKARLLCVTAKALASAGRKEESRNHFEEAYKAANQIPDDHDKDIMLCIILEQECLVAGESGEYARARDVAMKQVEISERCSLSNPNNRQTFFAYLNRGSAELDLAKIGKGDFSTALQNHLRALDIATALDNDIFKALVLNNLGEDSFHLGQKKSAKENFYKALSLWKQLERTKDEKELESLIIKYGLPLPKQQPRKAIKSGGSS